EAEERLGRREKSKDVVALVVQGRTADLHQPSVVGSAIDAELPQPRRIERARHFGSDSLAAARFAEASHGWMFVKFHDPPPTLCICKHICKKSTDDHPFPVGPGSFLAVLSSRAIPSSRSNSAAWRRAYS